jgi:hypothetical protein
LKGNPINSLHDDAEAVFVIEPGSDLDNVIVFKLFPLFKSFDAIRLYDLDFVELSDLYELAWFILESIEVDKTFLED